MAIFLAKLLNSPAGQAGLFGLDSHAHRVSVQTYFTDTRDVFGTLDNVGGVLHVQTFYPLFKVEGGPMAQYNIGTMKKTVAISPDGVAHVTLEIV